jgi:universal stress protein A
MPAYTHLLVAVDFSGGTNTVIETAMSLAGLYQARLSLIHIVEFAQVDLSNELVMPQELELDRELEQLTEQRLLALSEKYGLADSRRIVRHGSTRREILAVAVEEKVDLIVIGSHGRHGIQLLLGSSANAVLHGAPCDVLAVRIRD